MISLKHAFYDSGKCLDFSIIPDTQTAKLLNNHRCVIKPNTNKLSVYVPVDEQIPLIPFDKNDRLFFDLILQTGEFALYSDQCIELSSPNDLKLYQAGKLITSNLFDPSNSNGPLSIAIQRDFNQVNVTPDEVEIRFFAKPLLWLYYVVTDLSKNDSSLLTIEDAGQETLKTTWRQLSSSGNDSVYAQLTRQYPAKTIVCFVSEKTLDCQESCRKHLQLRLDGHTIFEQLPGPSYRNFFRVVTDEGSKPADAIYEIVKYFTNTTLIKG